MDAVRVILVDPNAQSRQGLQKLFEAIGGVELIEICPAYQNAIRRIAALAPDIALCGDGRGCRTSIDDRGNGLA